MATFIKTPAQIVIFADGNGILVVIRGAEKGWWTLHKRVLSSMCKMIIQGCETAEDANMKALTIEHTMNLTVIQASIHDRFEKI